MEKDNQSNEDIKFTESQKSVVDSYFNDNDSGSDKNISSGKETYVIAIDDSDDSDFPLHRNESVVNLLKTSETFHDVESSHQIHPQYARASLHKFKFVGHESYTQTSKTIIELAEADLKKRRVTLQTQTSLISVTENKTVEYNVEILEQESSKYSEIETENSLSDSIENVDLEIGSKINLSSDETDETQRENTSDLELVSDSDVEDDSLMEYKTSNAPYPNSNSDTSEVPKSVDNDIEDLYAKLSEHFETHTVNKLEGDKRNGILTPLTEESTIKRDSVDDIAPNNANFHEVNNVLFTNSSGIKIKLLPEEEINIESFKLPPIQNSASCPNNPHIKLLLSENMSKSFNNVNILSSVAEIQKGKLMETWKNLELASGEHPQRTFNESNTLPSGNFLLPPILGEGHITKNDSIADSHKNNTIDKFSNATCHHDTINITSKIRELKISCRTRSVSPDERRFGDVAERGREVLCSELLRRLRCSSWLEVVDTLQELPTALEKHWEVISEPRVADLIRQVCSHVESPRTQVARTACSTLACVIKNTNYTKKPDFYEAITVLLSKTGSYRRPVRRAANMALDEIVCSIDFTQAVTVLCVHGASHKSALVRCATARLLVVSCALAAGGRGLLRSRPPTAVCARRYTLRSLAALLEDKSVETRQYAERLYGILRPLPNFEAYFLHDVEVEVATRHLRKYDQISTSKNR